MTTKTDKLVTRILESIESGEYDIGDRLPTYTEMGKWGYLAAQISPAIGRLTDLGILERRHGKGVYVRSMPFPAEMNDARRDTLRRKAQDMQRLSQDILDLLDELEMS